MVNKDLELKTEAFIRLWEKELAASSSYEQAYEKIESIHKDNFGSRKFPSYDAFRMKRIRILKSK